MAFQITAGESLRGGAKRVVVESARLAADELRQAVAHPEGHHENDALHTARKALKGLRSLLRLFQDGVGKAFAGEDDRLREVARRLSERRDQAVIEQTLLSFRDDIGPSVIEAASGAIRPSRAVRVEPTGPLLTDAADSLEAAADRWAYRHIAHPRRSAVAGGRRVYQQSLRRCRRLRLADADECWHRWRKSVKHHWNHTRLLAALHPAIAGYADAAGSLASRLGSEHDLRVLKARLAAAEVAGTPSLAVLNEAIDRRARRHRRKAKRLGQTLLCLSPRDFERLLASILRRLPR